MAKAIVLGRFQPFHNGHAFLVKKAAELYPNEPVMIAIGSAQAEWEPNNPWSAQDRESMIRAWADSVEFQVQLCTIEDINDPPNWVDHARQHHGEGTLVTSDAATSALYGEANFPVHNVDLNERERLEGGGFVKLQKCSQLCTMTMLLLRSYVQAFREKWSIG